MAAQHPHFTVLSRQQSIDAARALADPVPCWDFQLGSQVEKITVLEQLEKVLITVDELVDEG